MRKWTATISIYPGEHEVTYNISWWRPGVPLRWPAKPHRTHSGSLPAPVYEMPHDWLGKVLEGIIRQL